MSERSSASTKRPQSSRTTASRPCLTRISLTRRTTEPVKVPVTLLQDWRLSSWSCLKWVSKAMSNLTKSLAQRRSIVMTCTLIRAAAGSEKVVLISGRRPSPITRWPSLLLSKLARKASALAESTAISDMRPSALHGKPRRLRSGNLCPPRNFRRVGICGASTIPSPMVPIASLTSCSPGDSDNSVIPLNINTSTPRTKLHSSMEIKSSWFAWSRVTICSDLNSKQRDSSFVSFISCSF
mmetsp:Transcript_89930/g.179628  ORF Transcript_89930/g.179628 Transcript_89930/m.179628 type:complete len:239 (-) Transcript_89930:1730-2446(-)